MDDVRREHRQHLEAEPVESVLRGFTNLDRDQRQTFISHAKRLPEAISHRSHQH
ncbi:MULTISPECIES: hypothetical protein [unclassified Streptomyces]|uniref:hypothetical protein n=1 Tax=unclassified Streptomyces TaxID=2593676 RepID=UPI0036FBB914